MIFIFEPIFCPETIRVALFPSLFSIRTKCSADGSLEGVAVAEVVAEVEGFAEESLCEGDDEGSAESLFTSFVPFSAPAVLSALILP